MTRARITSPFNLRSKPEAIAATQLKTLPTGKLLEFDQVVTGKPWNGCDEWGRVALYVHAPGVAVDEAIGAGRFLWAYNVRSQPSLDPSSLLFTARRGQVLDMAGYVTGQSVGGNNQWARCFGYVNMLGLDVLEETPTVTIAGAVCPPVGDDRERENWTAEKWPGRWYDATGYARYYEIVKGVWNYHTGADLNLPGDADSHQPCYAVADGEVTFAGHASGTWGTIVVIRHERAHTRYAHLHVMDVVAGDHVVKGQPIGLIGGREQGFQDHLHFDVSRSGILETKPDHWPGVSRTGVLAHYVDPLKALREGV